MFRKVLFTTILALLCFLVPETQGTVNTAEITFDVVTSGTFDQRLRSWITTLNTDIVAAAGDETGTGDVWYVDSDVAAGLAGTSWALAFDTVQDGVDACAANNGDIIYVAQGHAEDIGSAAALTIDNAGITIIGMGNGDDMPELSFTVQASTISITAADVTIYNIRFLGEFAGGSTLGLDVQTGGDGLRLLGCEFRSNSNNEELLIALNISTTVNNLVIAGNSFVFETGGSESSAIVFEGISNKVVIAGNYFNGEWSDYVILGTGGVSVQMLVQDNIIHNIDGTSGKLISFNGSSTGDIVHNICYGVGASQAIVANAMFVSPDNVTMTTENVETRTYETMLGPYRGDAAATAGDSVFADIVLIDALIDLVIADFTDYQLDHVAGVSTTVNADSNLETYVVDKSVLSHIMTAGADTSDYLASTMSLEALNTDLDTIIVDTGTTLPATLTGINNSISAISQRFGYAGTCEVNAGAGTVTCSSLGGFGNDYFNTGWSLICILDFSAPGSAPEGEVRDITDYVSGSGLFTVSDNFTAVVTTSDGIMLFRTDALNPEDPAILGSSGDILYVDASAVGDGSGRTMENAYATLTLALDGAVESTDTIIVSSGHAETISAAYAINDIGVRIVGLGIGTLRPTFTFDTLTATADFNVSVANVTFENMIFTADLADLVSCFDVAAGGDGLVIKDCLFTSTATTKEFLTCIKLAGAADDVTIENCTFLQFGTDADIGIGAGVGDAALDNLRVIDCAFYGDYDNGCIYSDQDITNSFISGNVLHQETSGVAAFDVGNSATGTLVDNKMYMDDYGANGVTMLDPGTMICINNWATDAADNQAFQIPISATTENVTAVADGSALERLELLHDMTDDALAAMGIEQQTDNTWYVDGPATNAGTGISWEESENTLVLAIGDVTTATGSTIFIAPNHTENITTLLVNKAGMKIIGLGTGENRPILTWNDNADTLTHSHPNVMWKNIIFTVSGQDAAVAVILDGASDGAVFEDCVFRGDGAGLEFVSMVTFSAAACNNVRFTRCIFDNQGGAGATAAITNIVGAQVGLTIEDCKFIGVWSEAAINSTQTDLNMVVRDNLVSNTSTGQFAIELEHASSTGFIVNNMCYGDTYGTVIDPGGLMAYGNRVSSAVDQSGSVYPAVPQQIDRIHGTGQVFYVDSSGTDGDGRTWATAKITLDKGVGLCTSNRGDFIYVAQGHAEAMGAGTGCTLDIAGISIIGLGNGDNMPIITFDNGASTIVTTTAGDNVLIENIHFSASVDSVLIGLNVVANTDNLTIRNCVFASVLDGTDEFDQSILIGNACIGTTIDGCTFRMANNEAVVAISSDDDTDRTTIKNCLIMGDYSTGCIEFSTVASTDLHILDNILINGDLVGDNGLNSEPCLEIVDATGGFVKGNFFASDMAGNHLAMTVADDMVFMENFSTDDDGDDFEGTQRSTTTAVTPSADG